MSTRTPLQALKFWILALVFFFFFSASLYSQSSVNANDKVPAYSAPFSYGTNMGYYPNWSRQQLADISAGNAAVGVEGAGVNALRPMMREEHFDLYGYGHLVGDFQHYESLGIRNNTTFIGYPAPKNADNSRYGGCNEPSKLFKNLYEPIWDSGANGTPVNENNYYALHVYKTVSTYKDHVKIWEIINEPDYTHSDFGWKAPDEAGSWWNNNPNPCDLPNLRAPVFSYIRMLRISYEVIKHVDPTAFVAVGGIGYQSFLDVLLRNTDNPDGGKVTAAYPDKGGAYFDVLSYHCYPQYSLKAWDNSVGGMVYRRHSDAAVDVLTNQQELYQDVLDQYGYNGNQFPKKHYIITETNVPRKNIGDVIAGDQVQVNYIIKALVDTQKKGVKQLHVYGLGDSKDFNEATNVYEAMGLYKNLNKATPYNQQYNDIGIAYKTTSKLLSSLKYNANLTRKLKLPTNIGGGVFKKGKTHVAVLWAKTTTDNSETANATYSFPSNFNISGLIKREWDYGVTNRETFISPKNVSLTGAPVFLEIELGAGKTADEQISSEVNIYPNPASGEVKISTASENKILRVVIKNQMGRTVLSRSVDNGSTSGINLDISGLKSGVFTVVIDTEEGREVKKLVKE